ncbi:hypothetical protein TFLX_05922 [Thermoflexales bacterium]|nr:hypothetical protein TFLX_05922 [Thermoflexales bacterium]
MTRRRLLIVGMVSVALLTLLAMINFVYAQESGPQAVEAALGTAFTYQGQLRSGETEVTGSCDMAFRLYDAVTVGNPIGTPLTQTVTVNAGLFTTQLDFGTSAFHGQARWLEIAVKCSSDTAFTTLSRQALTAAPYALYATTALTATNFSGALAGDVTGSQGNTTVTRLQGRNVSSGLPANGTVLEYNGTAWAPAIDNDTTNVGGDLSGTQTNATVTHLQGRSISNTAPTTGQVLKYNGATWAPGTDNDTTYMAGVGLGLQGTTFRVSPSYQLPQGCDSTQIAKWTGSAWMCAADDTASYQNVVMVAKSGGDYTTISAALTSITNASATNHYLVKVMPGVYTETVTMKQYVDIEGAGELATTITYIGSTSYYTGTVLGANNAELRFLTVVNTGGNTYAVAIFNNSASPRLTNVTATSSGGTDSNRGVFNYDSSSPTMTDVTATGSGGAFNYGVSNSSSSPTMMNVTATGLGGSESNYGVDNISSSPTMMNMTATGSGGTESHGVSNRASSSPRMTNVTAIGSGGTINYGVDNIISSPVIQNSRLSASGGTNNYGIYNYAPNSSYTVIVNNSQVTGSTNTIRNDNEFTTRVGASLLSGGAVAGGGTVTCAGVYDEAYAFYASTCP